jgi:hypothetical protein
LEFSTELAPGIANEICTDRQRVEQVLRNLLANAIKFTESSSVKIRMQMAAPDHDFESDALKGAGKVLALSIIDTGIGIAKNKQRLIFEAFQQADGGTSRRYGGRGLGLSISREIARALGEEIQVESSLGKGSTFTLYVPIRYAKEVHFFGTREDEAGVHARPTDQIEVNVVATTGVAMDFLAAEPTMWDFSGEARHTLADKTVLIVDDDPRNLFAVSSLPEAQGMKTLQEGKRPLRGSLAFQPANQASTHGETARLFANTYYWLKDCFLLRCRPQILTRQGRGFDSGQSDGPRESN